MPACPWWALPYWPAEKHRGRSQVERSGEPHCPNLHPPPSASFPIPELFIIEELPEMECELGAQRDFVLSCSLPPVTCRLSGAGRECAEPCWDLSPSKGVSASTREAECGASWGLCRRCSFQEIITPCPFKLAPKIEHGEAAQ